MSRRALRLLAAPAATISAWKLASENLKVSAKTHPSQNIPHSFDLNWDKLPGHEFHRYKFQQNKSSLEIRKQH